MAISTTATLDDILPKFIAEARLTREHMGVMEKLLDVIPLPREEGMALNVPKWNTTTAYSLTEGVDMAQAQTLSDSATTITPAEVGVQVVITDRVLRKTPEPVMRRAGTIMGSSMAKKRDQDLLTLNDGYSVTYGGAGTTLGVGHLLAAFSALLGNSTEAPLPPYRLVLHAFQWHDIASDFLGTSSGALADEVPHGVGQDAVLKGYTLPQLFGVTIFLDNNISIDSSDDTEQSALFAQKASIYVPVMGDIVAPQRDESLRGTEVNLVTEYGYGEYQDAWGRQIISDATAPTV